MFTFMCAKGIATVVRHRDSFDNAVYCAQYSAGRLAKRCINVDEWLQSLQAASIQQPSLPQLVFIIQPTLLLPLQPVTTQTQLGSVRCPPDERFKLNVEWQAWLFHRMRTSLNEAGVFARPPGVV